MDNLSPDQILQMISMLQKMLPKENTTKEHEEEIISQAAEEKPLHKKSRPKFVNKFDQMQESKLHKEDTAVDKLLSVYSPTPRHRDFDPVEVKCRVCGKSEKINPNILYDSPSRYKCNNCSRSPG
jgi:hypothetical protein